MDLTSATAGRRRGVSCSKDYCPARDAMSNGAYAYLLGLYLGDGSLARAPRRPGVMRLEIWCCDDYPALRAECCAAIAGVLPGQPVGIRQSTGCSIVSSYSRHWTCLFPQHGPGRKHQRRIVLEPWQRAIALDDHPELLIRGLIHSDGSRCVNRVVTRGKRYEYVRYFFYNHSLDIQAIFREACDRLAIDVRNNSPFSLSIARRASVERLDQLVGPKR